MRVLTEEDIRRFLKDYPGSNELLGEAEFSADRIRSAIRFVIDEWNETPPLLTRYTEENFPYRTTLLYGVCGHLYEGEAIAQERNHLTYQSGGLTVDDDNSSSAYFNFANRFYQKFKELMERQKRAENLKKAWSTIPSGYSSIPRY